MAMKIKSEPVKALPIVQKAKIQQERYLPIIFDPSTPKPFILASAAGGVDMEESACLAPVAPVLGPANRPEGAETITLLWKETVKQP